MAILKDYARMDEEIDRLFLQLQELQETGQRITSRWEACEIKSQPSSQIQHILETQEKLEERIREKQLLKWQLEKVFSVLDYEETQLYIMRYEKRWPVWRCAEGLHVCDRTFHRKHHDLLARVADILKEGGMHGISGTGNDTAKGREIVTEEGRGR